MQFLFEDFMKKIILLILISLSFYSCKQDSSTDPGDNNNNPTPTGAADYLPNPGMWMIMDNYILDEDNNREDMEGSDSIYVHGYEMVEGYEALKMETFYENELGMPESDVSYLRADGSAIYAYAMQGELGMFEGFGETELPDLTWTKVFDMDADEWEVIDTEVELDIFEGFPAEVAIQMNARRSASTKDFEYNGKVHEAIEIVFDTKFQVTINIQGFSQEIESEIENRMWYVPGFGMVRSITAESEFESPFGSEVEPGTESILVSHGMN